MKSKSIIFCFFCVLTIVGCQTTPVRYDSKISSKTKMESPYKFYLKKITIETSNTYHGDLKKKATELRMTLQQKYPYILSQQKENAIPIDICIKQKSMIENPDHLSGFSSFFTLGLIPNIQNINSTWEIQLITGKLTQKKQFDVKMKCSYPIGILEDLLQTHSIPAPIENFDINDRRYNFSLLSFDENAPKFIQLFYDALTKFEREITDRIYARNV